MSYTKGPWHWDSDPIKNDPFGRVRFRVCTLGRTITQCYHSSGDEYAEANARLISAAPDLLEALIEARQCWGDYLPKNGNSRAAKAMKAVDSAIAKATRGQP